MHWWLEFIGFIWQTKIRLDSLKHTNYFLLQTHWYLNMWLFIFSFIGDEFILVFPDPFIWISNCMRLRKNSSQLSTWMLPRIKNNQGVNTNDGTLAHVCCRTDWTFYSNSIANIQYLVKQGTLYLMTPLRKWVYNVANVDSWAISCHLKS